MKEIKFRAWDGEKMYVPPNDLEHTIGMLRYTDPDTIVGIAFGKNFGDCDYTSENTRNMIFMQYTGLKDKNGVEIFEGDIVKYKHQKYDKDYNISLIEYSNYLCAFTINGRYFSSIDTAIMTLEVIGNIYQNPELLD